ncbi:hypothetical protein [Orenia marismortui]|uniref:Uncharacterized protein n=1 Tax=Orenia marismortui TaxID=46469 RepID=A0A4R8GR87_9FIRM|nr:hypothetical protein [Orenia marismortui]TDX48318.1 hypothetical protein C7959_13045 [Orenia marismortui]
MSKTEKAIQLFLENPFRELSDIAEEAGVAESTFRSALSRNDYPPKEMRAEALKQVKQHKVDFEFDWSKFGLKTKEVK